MGGGVVPDQMEANQFAGIENILEGDCRYLIYPKFTGLQVLLVLGILGVHAEVNSRCHAEIHELLQGVVLMIEDVKGDVNGGFLKVAEEEPQRPVLHHSFKCLHLEDALQADIVHGEFVVAVYLEGGSAKVDET